MSDCFGFRVAVASLSGEADSEWAAVASPHVGAAFLGGIALDEPTREAARGLMERNRSEFLPPDPISFIDEQFSALHEVALQPGFNVRTVSYEPLRAAARVCHNHDAILEINAHCRQPEMCAVGAGQTLLTEAGRLADLVTVAAETDVPVSVKVRAEVDGVELPVIARQVVDAGAEIIHIDAMDSEQVVAEVVKACPTAYIVANNGVRDWETLVPYLCMGADAVSVGRLSDTPRALRRIRHAADEWFAEYGPGHRL